MSDFTNDEIEHIIKSLEYSVRAFQNYTEYPSYLFKVERIKFAERVLDKVRRAKREKKWNFIQ